MLLGPGEKASLGPIRYRPSAAGGHGYALYFVRNDLSALDAHEGEAKEAEVLTRGALCYEPVAEPCRQQCEETIAGRYAVR